jgi:hypothetical protein
MKRPALLSIVALTRDLPEFGLALGDAGVVVEVLGPDEVIIEFMDAQGDTVALLDMNDADVRTIAGNELKHLQHAKSLGPNVEPIVADATRAATGGKARTRRTANGKA